MVVAPLDLVGWVGDLADNNLAVAAFVVILGLVLGLLADRLNRRVLTHLGVPEAVEGTAFERTMRGFGTSTVSIIARLSMWFIIGVSLLAALSLADPPYTQAFWARTSAFLPELFVAILVLIVGIVVGDKLELVFSERLRGVKLPQVSILPKLVKYSVVYLAVLVAMGQIGVATDALLVLLAAFLIAAIVFPIVAFYDLLRSGAAGIYLILNQPYGIGDEIRIGDYEGIVQEVTVFVTRVESDSEEFVVPNRKVFDQGFARSRD